MYVQWILSRKGVIVKYQSQISYYNSVTYSVVFAKLMLAMQIIKLTENNQPELIQLAQKTLEAGGLIIYPTETVYGVGVSALNPEAVTKLLKYKNRPAGKAISVLVSSQVEAEKYVELNSTAKNLYQNFLPGPLTIISKDLSVVDSRLISEFKTLGIRISSHLFASTLAENLNIPITATSANPSGGARPYSIEKLLSTISEKQKELIDLIIDLGVLPKREPSTVIDTTHEVQEILRSGSEIDPLFPVFRSLETQSTIAFAENFLKSIEHQLTEGPVFVLLDGDLGAGKTHFAKGLAKGLKIDGIVSSPTYTIMKEYQGTSKMLHLDCWRMEDVELDDLISAEYLQAKNLIVLEWGSKLESALKEKFLGYKVYLEILGENERNIKIGSL